MREGEYLGHHRTREIYRVSFYSTALSKKNVTLVIKNIYDNLLKFLNINAHGLFGFLE